MELDPTNIEVKDEEDYARYGGEPNIKTSFFIYIY